nr:MAG TPA: receptor binding protein [Caudoviricetes sp.]
MATNTPNFSLPKPDANDNFNRAAYNTLIDAIDTKVGAKTSAADAHMADLIKHITAGERDKWNAAQLVKLTQDNLEGIVVNDFLAINKSGFFKLDGIVANNPLGLSTDVYFSAIATYTGGEITILAYDRIGKRYYTALKTGGSLSAWSQTETTTGAQAKVDTHAADAVKHITTPERDKWNGGQLWKLTDNDGANKVLTKTDTSTLRNRSDAGIYTTTDLTIGLPPKLQPSERYGTLHVLPRDNGSVQQIFYSYEGRVFHRYLLSSSIYYPSYSDNAGWIEFTTVGKLASAVMGNKFVDQSNANFVGKVSGSTTANPHIAKAGYANSLVSPSGFSYELLNADYNAIFSIGGAPQTTGSSLTSGTYALSLFSFNLIEHVQRTYGTIPGTTTTDKVAWLKSNLSKLTFNWWGFGSSVGGNKATVNAWRNDLNAWNDFKISNTASTTTKIGYIIESPLSAYIDVNGFIHFLAYAEASDGTTASVINTDYVELNVELSTDIKSGLANATQSSAGLQSSADKTKLDGISTGANKTTNPAINGSIAIDGVPTVVYAHPTGDGSSHVPATGTTNNGKVLKAGGTANALSWAFVDWSEIINKPSTYLPSTHNHAITDITGLSTALSNKLDTSQRGAASGVASLGADGKVPTSQLPTIANTAADITIADSGNYFDGANVETGMQEIGRVLAGSRASLVASAQQLGVI